MRWLSQAGKKTAKLANSIKTLIFLKTESGNESKK
jgi:hypothetical protein